MVVMLLITISAAVSYLLALRPPFIPQLPAVSGVEGVKVEVDLVIK
jgi:hypothetical protein